jgi:hypothetical protein
VILRVHKLSEVDPDKIIRLGSQFFLEFKLPGIFSGDYFIAVWEEILRGGSGAMWVSIQNNDIVGGIGGVLSPDLFTGDTMAMEAFWFMRRDCRGSFDSVKLLTTFEEWGIQVGAKRIVMIHLCPDNYSHLQAESVYQRRGYIPLEKSFYKML